MSINYHRRWITTAVKITTGRKNHQIYLTVLNSSHAHHFTDKNQQPVHSDICLWTHLPCTMNWTNYVLLWLGNIQNFSWCVSLYIFCSETSWIDASEVCKSNDAFLPILLTKFHGTDLLVEHAHYQKNHVTDTVSFLFVDLKYPHDEVSTFMMIQTTVAVPVLKNLWFGFTSVHFVLCGCSAVQLQFHF